MSSQEDRNKPKSGRLLMIALLAAVIVAFIVSGGFVLAKQQLIQRQTTRTFPDCGARTARAGDADIGRRLVADDRTAGDHSRLHRDSGLREGRRIHEDHQRRQGRSRERRGSYRDHRISGDGQDGVGCALFLLDSKRYRHPQSGTRSPAGSSATDRRPDAFRDVAGQSGLRTGTRAARIRDSAGALRRNRNRALRRSRHVDSGGYRARLRRRERNRHH